MIRIQPDVERADSGRLWLDVDDQVLRLALQQVAAMLGCSTVANPAASNIHVADHLPSNGEIVDVLVATPSPLGARIAVGALSGGAVRAVIPATQPEQLGFAVRALGEGWMTAPSSIVRAARRLPPISQRQHDVLSHLARGVPNDSGLARRLGLSTATVRRVVQELYDLMDLADRHALAERARHLGYADDRLGGIPAGDLLHFGVTRS